MALLPMQLTVDGLTEAGIKRLDLSTVDESLKAGWLLAIQGLIGAEFSLAKVIRSDVWTVTYLIDYCLIRTGYSFGCMDGYLFN